MDRPWRVQTDIGPAGPGYYLTFSETGTMYFGASPFMRPAYEAARPYVTSVWRSAVRENIVSLARRTYAATSRLARSGGV